MRLKKEMTHINGDWIRTITSSDGTNYTFCGALEYRYKHIAKNWNEETRRKYAREYNDIILPALKNHNVKTIDEYTKEDYEEAIDNIREKGFERNGIMHKYAESTIHHFQNLIHYVVFQSSVYRLCVDVLWGTKFTISKLGEEVERESRVHLKKSLSAEQEKSLLKELLTDPYEDGTKVALLLMWGLGLRNSEACGLNYCDIKSIEGYPECYAAWIYKTTKIESNELQSGGKTFNTGRIVPVPEKILVFLSKRKKKIIEMNANKGLTDVNVEEFPICNVGSIEYDSDDYLTRCKADNVTTAAHSVFDDAKIISEQIAYLDLELSDGKTASILKEKEPTAYLLRRNYATQMCVLGLTNAEMQYLLGHNVEDAYESRNDFVNSERIYSMFLKLQKRSILNNVMNNNNTIEISIPRKSTLKIIVTAAEPTDNVSVIIKAKNPKMIQTKWFESSHKGSYDRTVNILEQYNNGYQGVGKKRV